LSRKVQRKIEAKAYQAMEKILNAFNKGQELTKDMGNAFCNIIRYTLAGRHKTIEKEPIDDPLDRSKIKGFDPERF